MLRNVPKGNVPLRMRDGDPAGLPVVLELCVTALAGHFVPTISLKGSDYGRAFHVYKYTLVVIFARLTDIGIGGEERGPMWMLACREILRAYAKYGSPLQHMEGLKQQPELIHIYSQPLSAEYRQFQEDYCAGHPWFRPAHIPGQTHFPTLENPAAVAKAIVEFGRG